MDWNNALGTGGSSGNRLNRQQLGFIGESVAKIAFTLEGFEVYATAYDDRGIDFVVRGANNIFLPVQVKTTNNQANPFILAKKFESVPGLLFCSVRFVRDADPVLHLAVIRDWSTAKGNFLKFNSKGGDAGPYYEMNLIGSQAADGVSFEFSKYIRTLC